MSFPRNKRIFAFNKFHNRLDEILVDDLDFILAKSIKQQRAIKVKLPDKTLIYTQPGHYNCFFYEKIEINQLDEEFFFTCLKNRISNRILILWKNIARLLGLTK